MSSTLPICERLPVRVAKTSTLAPLISAGRVALPEPTVIDGIPAALGDERLGVKPL